MQRQLFFFAFFLTAAEQLCTWAAEAAVFNSTACSFPCENGGEVPLSTRCDGKPNCADSSDERGCNSGSVLCGPDEWQCGIGGPCLPLEWFCNCYLDCPGSSDELAEDCELQKAQPKAGLPSSACSEDEFQCALGTACFPLVWRCDGHADCVDEQDEQNCGLDMPASSVASTPGVRREQSAPCGSDFRELLYKNSCQRTVTGQRSPSWLRVKKWRIKPSSPENKAFPAKDPQGIHKDPVYLAVIAIVALLIATVAGVSVALWECKKTKRSSSSYKLADWFTV